MRASSAGVQTLRTRQSSPGPVPVGELLISRRGVASGKVDRQDPGAAGSARWRRPVATRPVGDGLLDAGPRLGRARRAEAVGRRGAGAVGHALEDVDALLDQTLDLADRCLDHGRTRRRGCAGRRLRAGGEEPAGQGGSDKCAAAEGEIEAQAGSVGSWQFLPTFVSATGRTEGSLRQTAQGSVFICRFRARFAAPHRLRV